MKKIILLGSIIAIFSIFLFSSRTRTAVANSCSEETKDKIYELKNVLSDFRKNQNAYK